MDIYLSFSKKLREQYDLIQRVALLSASIYIETNIIKGCLLLQKAALLFGYSLEKVWSLGDYSLEKVWRKVISTYKKTK